MKDGKDAGVESICGPRQVLFTNLRSDAAEQAAPKNKRISGVFEWLQKYKWTTKRMLPNRKKKTRQPCATISILVGCAAHADCSGESVGFSTSDTV